MSPIHSHIPIIHFALPPPPHTHTHTFGITYSFQFLLGTCQLLCISQFQVHLPPPPGQLRAFVCLVSPGGGALSNFAWPEGRGFAYPGATPGLLTHTWFPTRNPNVEDFIAKNQQFVADWIVCQGLDKLVEASSILCISSLLIKAQLELVRSGTEQRESTYTCFFDEGFK